MSTQTHMYIHIYVHTHWVDTCTVIYTKYIQEKNKLFIEEVEFGMYFAGAVLPTSHLKIFHLRQPSKMWHYHIGYGQTLWFWAAHICCTY